MKKDLSTIIFNFILSSLSDDELSDLIEFIHETKKIPTKKIKQLFQNPTKSKLRSTILQEILKTYSNDELENLTATISTNTKIPESKILSTIMKYLKDSN